MIQKSWAGSILIAKTEKEVNKRVKKYVQMRSKGLTRAKEMGFADYNLKPSLFGTPKQCIETIEDYIKAGVNHFMLNFPQKQLLRDLQLFAKEVISCF
jgi:alkanesulfonate monooxygenase SsuD/methylene tetrahydromethanopterin reductase-like flavin-dependent oxidoreductase (luciferase family)